MMPGPTNVLVALRDALNAAIAANGTGQQSPFGNGGRAR